MKYYTYQYLRPDGSPYYVGKGSGDRVYNKNRTVAVPTLDRIRIQYHFDEAMAFAYERYMIDFWGRKDLGTGILRNMTDGGDGAGHLVSEATRVKLRVSLRGNTNGLGKVCSVAKRAAIRKKQLGRPTGKTPWNKGRTFAQFNDLTGRVFGRLTVQYPTPQRDANGNIVWHCICECGTMKETVGVSLRRNLTRSCGCLNGVMRKARYANLKNC